MALDTIIILPQAQFFKKKSYLWLMPLAECFHICYVVFFGLLSLSNTYTWKGRKVTNINGNSQSLNQKHGSDLGEMRQRWRDSC